MPKQPHQVPAGSIIPITPHSSQLLDPQSRVAAIVARQFADLKPNTLLVYQRAWDVLAIYLKAASREEAAALVTKMSAGEANAMTMAWRAEMERDKVGVSTVAIRIAALKGITKRLRIAGLISWRIEVRGPEVNAYKDTSGPGVEALQKVIAQLRERTDLKGVRDLAIVQSLYTTGLRRGELAATTLEDLDLEKNKIWIVGKDRDDEESVTIQPGAKEALEAWLKVHPGSSPSLFVSLDPHSYGGPLSGSGLYRITVSYGLGSPHGIRHSGVTTVLDKSNGNIRLAQKFSRHRNPKTLMKYDDNRRDLAGEAGKLLEEDL